MRTLEWDGDFHCLWSGVLSHGGEMLQMIDISPTSFAMTEYGFVGAWRVERVVRSCPGRGLVSIARRTRRLYDLAQLRQRVQEN